MMTRIHSIRERSRVVRGGVHFGIQGKIKSVELICAKTGLIKRRLTEFPNLIVDAALNAIGNGTTIDELVEYVAVGTDNTTPDASDTSLGAQVDDRYNDAGGFAETEGSGPAYAYWYYTKTREIGEDDGNGNLTELGFFEEATGGTMWCRQLFLSGGTPTTLVKTSDESLRIIYEWRLYLVTTPTTDALTIDGVPTDCDSRALSGNNAHAWGNNGYLRHLGAWETDPRRCKAFETNAFPNIDAGGFTGTGSQVTSCGMQAYGTGNFYRDQNFIFDPGVGNFTTGIGAMHYPSQGLFISSVAGLGVTFDPKIQKDDTERFTFVGRTSFGRV